MKTVLTIAGSDSSGGAGIQADIKTMTANGVYAMSAITALTAQNTMGVRQIVEVTPAFLQEQLEACLEDISADAVKIGMLPSVDQVQVVATVLKKYKIEIIVTDPVMVATSGSVLMKDGTRNIHAELLFPMSTLITPNIPEAEALTGMRITNQEEMEQAAEILYRKYGCNVLLKGGHSVENASDVLCEKGALTWFRGTPVDTDNTHGTGCTLSSSIASNLAKGYSLNESVSLGKGYVTRALAAGLNLGKGNGPLNHMV